MISDKDLAERCEAIWPLVLLLNEHGFETCDSRDGSEGVSVSGWDVPMIAIMSSAGRLIFDSHRVNKLLDNEGYEDNVHIESTFYPKKENTASILIHGEGLIREASQV